MVEQRLQKILAAAGFGARRKCEMIIAQGRVKVNGALITELGTKADPANDIIEVDGIAIHQQRKVYIMLNKPAGCITTVNDPRGRKTVMEYLADVPERVFPVGRLDQDTEGLLLFTNDGEFCDRITHPRFKVFKTYDAWITGIPAEEQLRQLREGVPLGDTVSAPAEARLLQEKELELSYKGKKKNTLRRTPCSMLEIRIQEGRKRQVKRMIKAIGFRVISLKRTKVGNLELGDLPTGKYRYLDKKEIELIFSE